MERKASRLKTCFEEEKKSKLKLQIRRGESISSLLLDGTILSGPQDRIDGREELEREETSEVKEEARKRGNGIAFE